MKIQLMVLTRKGKSHEPNEINVKIGDATLSKKNCVTYLGMKLDKELSWKVHIENMHRQCSAKLAIIRSACHYLRQKVTAALYQAFVLPHTDYCSVAWNNCGAVLSQRVERIQNYALRMIMRKPPMTRSELMRASLGWPTLETRRRNAVACLVHRCRLGQAPSFVCSKFKSNVQTGYTGTRGESVFMAF